MITDPSLPAYPCQSDRHGKQHPGLTKREYFAAMAMIGLIAAGDTDAESISVKAVTRANHLINELNGVS